MRNVIMEAQAIVDAVILEKLESLKAENKRLEAENAVYKELSIGALMPALRKRGLIMMRTSDLYTYDELVSELLNIFGHDYEFYPQLLMREFEEALRHVVDLDDERLNISNSDRETAKAIVKEHTAGSLRKF